MMTSIRPLVVKLLFSLYTLVTPSVVNRASGFLKREAVICLERTSIRAGFFCQTPNAVFALRGFWKRREPEGGAIPN